MLDKRPEQDMIAQKQLPRLASACCPVTSKSARLGRPRAEPPTVARRSLLRDKQIWRLSCMKGGASVAISHGMNFCFFCDVLRCRPQILSLLRFLNGTSGVTSQCGITPEPSSRCVSCGLRASGCLGRGWESPTRIVCTSYKITHGGPFADTNTR